MTQNTAPQAAFDAAIDVVIPAFNEALQLPKTLPAIRTAMAAVQAQGELIVVDNGSTDDSVEIAESFADRIDLRVVDAHEKPGINVARNRGVMAARGDLFLFCDCDDHAQPGWLRAMAAPFVPAVSA